MIEFNFRLDVSQIPALLPYEFRRQSSIFSWRPYFFTLVGTCLFLFLCLSVRRQTSSKMPSGHPRKTYDEKDPIAILEVGAAQSWDFRGGAATFAPNVAAEVTPLENWLELEAGVAPFYTGN